MKKIAVLISGNGSNLQALIDAANTDALPDTQIALVVSNRAGAFGLTRAAQAGIPTLTMSLKAHRDQGKTREQYDADLAGRDSVVLRRLFACGRCARGLYAHCVAGVPRPLCGGAAAQSAPGAARREKRITRTGVMVHRVIADVDRGDVIVAEEVPILDTDTLESLEDRIHKVEHEIIVRGTRIALGL
ncbi:phosphoribosylglycinamide formyltransferase [Obelidium mucronatum]|nr:phosphoribosylglycinamide formyltransferase [Obelidium mucronatum]